ncbi:MAG TPA: ribonuclease Y [bacterium]|nr:ribonuclease Y [bacterium]
MDATTIIMLLVGLVLGAAFCYMALNLVFKTRTEKWRKDAEEARSKSEEILRSAELKAQEMLLEGRKETDRQKNDLLREFKEREKRLNKKEEQLDARDELLVNKEKDLKNVEKKQLDTEKFLENKSREIEATRENIRLELERIAGMTQEEAINTLVQKIEDEAKHQAAKKIKLIEDATTEDAEKISKNIIATAIQRYAGEYVATGTVTTVTLPSDEMKGRIIGREGRNIRAIEATTGSDLIIDDTPEAVVISDFNPVRREITRITLERLIADGRIHPGRIEELFNAATKEVWKGIKEAGEQALFDLGVHKMHPELVLLIGRLKYRTSYGQNMWKHSVESGFFAGMIAAEMNYNIKMARRAGLLHDIGKAVDHEQEGSHASLGARLAEKYGEAKKIVTAIEAHHNEIKPDSVLDMIVMAADALSGARPGARREMGDAYVQRLTDLENIANAFPGVDKTFAIQAGRELRVMVDASKVRDEDAYVMANDISKKIESDMTYPGQIKVVVIRETRVIAMAQ